MTRTKKLSDSEVLRLALKVIVDRGPDSFTLGEVSKKTRLSPATLIQRFKTKNNLLLEALKQDQADFSVWIQQESEKWKNQGTHGVVEFLSSMFQGFNGENLGEHVALLAKDFSDPKLHRMAKERMETVRKTIREILGESLKKDMNEFTYQIEAVWHGSVIQWGFIKQGSLREWVSDRLNSFFQYSLS